jgi:hypothetical protein
MTCEQFRNFCERDQEETSDVTITAMLQHAHSCNDCAEWTLENYAEGDAENRAHDQQELKRICKNIRQQMN